MKAILDKAKKTIGVWADDVGEFIGQKSEVGRNSCSPPRTACYSEYVDIPSPNFAFEKAQIGPDAVLFSKSGVCFKYPTATNFPHSNSSTPDESKMDSHISVPGYLFVASRGSNFGSTLILNWVSTSALTKEVNLQSMNSSAHETRGAVEDQSDFSGAHSAGGSHSNSVSLSNPSHQLQKHFGDTNGIEFSVSIDLFATEVIRIFCRKDGEGLTAGELVIKCDDQEFKVSTMCTH